MTKKKAVKKTAKKTKKADKNLARIDERYTVEKEAGHFLSVDICDGSYTFKVNGLAKSDIIHIIDVLNEFILDEAA